MILHHLDRSHVMAEWGSGGSTIVFSKYVRAYYSVEHDERWARKVRRAVAWRRRANVTRLVVPPDVPPDGRSLLTMTADERRRRFRSYIHALERFATAAFDRILVDGRARPECLEAALPFLASESLVFVHDYFAPHYNDAYREYYHGLVDRHFVIIDAIEQGQSLVVLRKRPDRS